MTRFNRSFSQIKLLTLAVSSIYVTFSNVWFDPLYFCSSFWSSFTQRSSQEHLPNHHGILIPRHTASTSSLFTTIKGTQACQIIWVFSIEGSYPLTDKYIQQINKQKNQFFQSMHTRIVSEVKIEEINVLLARLRNQGTIFYDWPKSQVDAMRNHFKFVRYESKQQLTKRGEPVDFIAFLITGSANVILEHKSQGYLQAGDSIGYMGVMGLQGCEVQQFDIYGKDAGIIAILKRDDLRHLVKRDPTFSQFLYVTLAVKALNAVNHQYLDSDYKMTRIQKTTDASIKKIMLYLDQLALTQAEIAALGKSQKRGEIVEDQNFRYYWNTLESRDKRLFVQCCNVLELQQDETLITQGVAGNYIYIIVYGQLENHKRVQYMPGETLGVKEFLTGDAYSETIHARAKSVLVRLSRQQLTDMFDISPGGGVNFLTMLTRYESFRLRSIFEKTSPHQKDNLYEQVERLIHSLKTGKRTKQLFPQDFVMQNYFELDITKSQLLSLDLIEKDKAETNIAPLYVLDTFSELIAKRSYQHNEIKDRKDPMNVIGMSWFLRDKAEEQYQRDHKIKMEERKNKKNGKDSGVHHNQTQHHHTNPEENQKQAERDLFEELNNETFMLKGELQKANEYIYTLEEQMVELKRQAKERFDENDILKTKLRKYEVHQELLKLNLAEENILQHRVHTSTTLFDTFKYQAQEARKFKTTIKAADKLYSSQLF